MTQATHIVNTVHTIADLLPDENNARIHSARNIGLLVDTLHEVGAARSIVIDENNRILAGNGLIEAASEAGIENVQVVEADGDTIIAVRRRGLTDEQKTRLALADNRANELSAWDIEVLGDLMEQGISIEGLWSDRELDELLLGEPPGEDDEGSGVGHIGGSAAPDAADKPGTEGLDRVTESSEMSQHGKFIHVGGSKVPVTDEEAADLEASLSAYREVTGSFYGFVGMLLACESRCEGAKS